MKFLKEDEDEEGKGYDVGRGGKFLCHSCIGKCMNVCQQRRRKNRESREKDQNALGNVFQVVFLSNEGEIFPCVCTHKFSFSCLFSFTWLPLKIQSKASTFKAFHFKIVIF